MQQAQLAGKLARLIEELQAHENYPEHAARLRVEIAEARDALAEQGKSRPRTERTTLTAAPPEVSAD